jgi:hypothetical protein
MVETPQSFVVATECQKVAEQNGFRRSLGETAGWAGYGSTTAHGTIFLAALGPKGPWFLGLDHRGVIEELGLPATDVPGPGVTRFVFESLGELYAAMHRVYQLAISLPDAPLQAFWSKIKDLPRSTEAEQLVIQRVGQDIFRASLMDYWHGRCPLTGITDPALLRASHIIPWKDCTTDGERLDVHNGLLLSALWDAAFDRGLVTFDDDGLPEFSPALSEAARAELRWKAPLSITDKHRKRLRLHRADHFKR